MMMREECNKPNDDTVRRLSEYVDGTLDPKSAVELMQQVAADRALQKELAALRAADELIRAHQDAIPNLDWESFSESVRQRVKKSTQAPSRPRQVFKIPAWRALAVAAVIAISITAFLLFDTTDNPQQTMTVAARIEVSIARPDSHAENAGSMGTVIVAVSHERPPGLSGYIGSDFVGPPYYERSILVTTGLN
jgi:anti-sigma factor RsiW